jgi:hypothetical protein
VFLYFLSKNFSVKVVTFSADHNVTFLSAFAKLRTATISFVMSVRLHGTTRLPHTVRIIMIFDIGIFFSSIDGENSSFSQIGQNNRYSAWRPLYNLWSYIIHSSRNNLHYALICTTRLLYILAPTCFGSSLPSSGSFLEPSFNLFYSTQDVIHTNYFICCIF